MSLKRRVLQAVSKDNDRLFSSHIFPRDDFAFSRKS